MNTERHSEGNVLIYGRQPVKEALAGSWPVTAIFLREGIEPHFANEIYGIAGSAGISVSSIAPSTFDRRFPRNSQGIVAKVREIELRDLDEVEASVPKGEDPFFVALDGIEDPHNLGAITRTALAMGVHAVVVPRRRSAALGEGAIKASTGAVFREPICQVPNVHYFIEWAKSNKMWIYGLDAGGETTLWDVDLSGPMALIVGGEDRGLSRLAKERCDFLIRIPMFGEIGSMNASVACGIAIAEIQRQRQRRKREQSQSQEGK